MNENDKNMTVSIQWINVYLFDNWNNFQKQIDLPPANKEA